MKFLKFTMALALLPLLSACAAGPDISKTEMMANPWSAFNQALQKEYVLLAKAEAEEWDTEDAIYFNNKAKAAASGEEVGPQPIKERNIKGAAADEIEAAKYALDGLLLTGGKEWAPAETARAQAMYDCWLQEREENTQQAHIDACIAGFNAAIDAAEAKRPKPMAQSTPSAPSALPGPYVVYFDFDSFELSASGEAIVKKAAAEGKAAGFKTVTVTGHTDKAGSSDYNAGLSRARAATVGNALMQEGIARDSVKRSYAGESFPEVSTKDGVKEAQNRRVVISFSR